MDKLTDKLTDAQIEAWIEALESGDYKQGQGDLYMSETDSYCCLGVLGKTMGHTLLQLAGGNSYDVLGSRDNMPANEDDDLNPYFWDMNDTQKLSFPQIAAKIRELVANEKGSPVHG